MIQERFKYACQVVCSLGATRPHQTETKWMSESRKLGLKKVQPPKEHSKNTGETLTDNYFLLQDFSCLAGGVKKPCKSVFFSLFLNDCLCSINIANILNVKINASFTCSWKFLRYINRNIFLPNSRFFSSSSKFQVLFVCPYFLQTSKPISTEQSVILFTGSRWSH